MDNLNTYVLDTLADTLGHAPTHADVATLNVPDTIDGPYGIPYLHGLTSHADLHATLNAREATRALRAALHALRTELAQS